MNLTRLHLNRSLEPDAPNPVVINGIRYRTTKGTEDLDAIVQLERAGWEDHLAFPEDYMKQDLANFPHIQVLAIQEETGQLVGKMSAVRLTTSPLDPLTPGPANWDQIYESQRDPDGAHCEGSGLVVDPNLRRQGIATTLGVMRARALAEENLRRHAAGKPIMDRFTFQARTVGFRAALNQFGVNANSPEEDIKRAHAEYVEAVAKREIQDQVLSTHFRIAQAISTNPGDVIVTEPNAPWPEDGPSMGLGVRFEMTQAVHRITGIIENYKRNHGSLL